MLTEDDITDFRARLRSRLEEISALDAASADSRATVVLDQQSVGRLSRMDALQSQAMAQETRRRRQAERARIHAALARIENDEYGWCAGCGETIPSRRLEIDPTLSRCVACAR